MSVSGASNQSGPVRRIAARICTARLRPGRTLLIRVVTIPTGNRSWITVIDAGRDIIAMSGAELT